MAFLVSQNAAFSLPMLSMLRNMIFGPPYLYGRIWHFTVSSGLS